MPDLQRFGPANRLGFAGRGRRWYLGALVSLLWLASAGYDLYQDYPDVSSRVIITLLLAVYGIFFAVIPPINWRVPLRFKLVLPTALWALSFALVPYLHWTVYSLWVYVGVVAAMSMGGIRSLAVYLIALVLAAVWFGIEGGVSGDALFAVPLVIGSVSLMMAAFARQIQVMNQLRATQHELARLAVAQERGRVARDIHDILGHSLTVITVKAELAGRLLETDPTRAGKEIAEVEDLARGALADVRATVVGYRGMSIASELANARSALESAGIRAELPGSADVVPAGRRELFGWVLREGITNVVRHSRASSCTVTLGASFVEIADDGRGPTETTGSGTGLTGLRERIQAAGARMTVGRSATGGFSLRVTL